MASLVDMEKEYVTSGFFRLMRKLSSDRSAQEQSQEKASLGVRVGLAVAALG